MAAHNYDGDMLTDEVAQVHRSPGFITSNLIGKAADGSLIKEFEASHGTVADLWEAHLRGEETSFNPLGMAEALIGAVNHAATLDGSSWAPCCWWSTRLPWDCGLLFPLGSEPQLPGGALVLWGRQDRVLPPAENVPQWAAARAALQRGAPPPHNVWISDVLLVVAVTLTGALLVAIAAVVALRREGWGHRVKA